ncbi:hypothetical protein DICVIV_07543 [Dictyocaulus viviparus]|uniref:Uncharacterized protein n=1 Tax=Dictyocaulus viviparus TaxID=29172 RepID=A0A0D8XPC0_DICVI|nr:hypothetical protein DICVIV_07543 [Dictyocaulus viviparus]
MTPSESLVAEETPKSYGETRGESCVSPPMSTKFETNPQVLSSTGLPCVKNKNNEGKLFVNGVPFWVGNINEDVTDEENVLNAAVILEVASGKLSLVNMPDESIILDMYADWTVLQSRDQKCFSKDVLFGNTVRSMVNLFETAEHEKSAQARHALEAKINVLNVDDPTMVVYYMVNRSSTQTDTEGEDQIDVGIAEIELEICCNVHIIY